MRSPGQSSGPSRGHATRVVVVVGVLAMLLLGSGARAERMRIDPAHRPRVVNGIDTHGFPTTGALLYSGGGSITPNNANTWCSGTLIGCATFLVAAHCVDDLDPDHYLVYLQHAGLVPVAAIARHPSYLDETFPRFDAAVIALGDWVTGIGPTPINQTDPLPFIPTAGTIIGFGQTGSGADYGIKRAGTVQLESCPAELPGGATDSDVLCWTFTDPLGPPGDDSNTCNGDSGGPLLLDLGAGTVVAGITSGGSSGDCMPVDQSYDASVFAHRDFILAQLGADSTTACGGLAPIGDADSTVIEEAGTLNGADNADAYTVSVPAGANALRVALNGEDNGAFDVNLYVKQGTGASSASFDCKADGTSAFGACAFDLPAAGTWSIAVERVAGAGQYQLTSSIFGGTAPACGNDTREFNEDCDGTDAALCPGLCAGDCTCPAAICGNDIAEQGEQCDGTDDASCPSQCDASCGCPPTCTQDDLFDIKARIDPTHLRVRGRVLNFGGAFTGADPRQRFTLTLTQGPTFVTIDIPADDPGWDKSKPERGKYKWLGDVGGIKRVRAVNRTHRDGTWKVLVVGSAVPGAGGIDVAQPVDLKLTIDHACTETTW